MKEFVLDIEFTMPFDSWKDTDATYSDDLDAAWDAVMHDIGDHGWVTDDCSEPCNNDKGVLSISAILTKQCTDNESTAFTLLLDICPDIRIVGGGLRTSTKEGG